MNCHEIITALRHKKSIEPYRKAVTAAKEDQDFHEYITLNVLWFGVF